MTTIATYEETLIAAQTNIKDAVSNGGSLTFKFTPIEKVSAENIINAAIASFGEKDLLKIISIRFFVLQLKTIPNNLCYFKNLQTLDLSYTNINVIPPWLVELQNLEKLDLLGTEIKKLPAFLRDSSKKMPSLKELDLRYTSLSMPRKTLYKNIAIKKMIYSLLYNHLDKLQKKINVCEWTHTDAGYCACLRNEHQCCNYEWVCDNLTDGGCSKESLACKIWLCKEALEHLNDMRRSGKKNSKYAKRYYNARNTAVFLCKVFNIPLKIRAGKDETFDKNNDGFINTKIKNWYNGIILYPSGYYPKD